MSHLNQKKYLHPFRELKIDFSSYTDPTVARKVLIRSLAYVLNSQGLSPDLIHELLKKLNINIDSKSLYSIKNDVTNAIGKVSLKELLQYSYTVQELLKADVRKTLAAYYTNSLGVHVISNVVKAYSNYIDKNLVIADPFMGSGVLLYNVIKAVGADKVRLTWGIEIDPLSCVLGYAILLGSMNGDENRVAVQCGDAFKTVWGSTGLFGYSAEPFSNADVIVSNPPFTRWELLSNEYRELLESFVKFKGYYKYVTRRQLNLQAISLFLIDSVLAKEGLLSTVLPLSTFYTIYGEGIKKMLKEKYSVFSLIQNESSAFSTGSGFKEVILIATKNDINKCKTAFVTIGNENDLKDIKFNKDGFNIETSDRGVVTYEDLGQLPKFVSQNWLLLFNPSLKSLISLITKLSDKGLLKPFSEVFSGDAIVRGVEMYGPNFFLLPNDYFAITEIKNDYIVIEQINSNNVLQIPKEFLILALRKPSLYKSRIVIENPGYYLLSIPPIDISSLPEDIKKYIEISSKLNTIRTAEIAFGKYWYSHVYRQIQSKKPFGYVFIPDKVDTEFKERGVYAIMSWYPLTATKNFYIVKNREYASVLTLWLNSSLFLTLFTQGSRKISETWTRYLKDDILNIPIPNEEIMKEHAKEAENIIRQLIDKEIPSFKHHKGSEVRRKIDEFVLNMLGISETEISYLQQLLLKAINSG